MKETDFAQYLTQFLSVYLPCQVGSKRNTQIAYRDSFSLFLRYCRDQENLLLQSGVNLVYIRDLLGHSDISTTEIYARADEKMKRKALMEAYNSPSSDELPAWKKDKDLLDWLKSL